MSSYFIPLEAIIPQYATDVKIELHRRHVKDEIEQHRLILAAMRRGDVGDARRALTNVFLDYVTDHLVWGCASRHWSRMCREVCNHVGGLTLNYSIGIDTGGTFTDLVSLDQEGTIQMAKTLSTPQEHDSKASLLARVLGPYLGSAVSARKYVPRITFEH